MQDLEEVVSDLREKISTERNVTTGRPRFSPALKDAVTDFVARVGSRAGCARRLGLAESVLERWVKSKRLPVPRRLIVKSGHENPILLPLEKRPEQTFEAVLANGIVIKGLSLTTDCLQMLGAVR